MPRLTVAIATRDRADSLRRLLNGLVAEDAAAACEFVLVNDGGVRSPIDEAVENLGDAGHRAQAFHRAWEGPSGARNMAIAGSSGDALLFLNDDLVPDPGLLAAHLAALERHPRCAISGNTRWAAEEATNQIQHFCAYLRHTNGIVRDGGELRAEELDGANWSISRATLGELRFDERLKTPPQESLELAFRLEAAGIGTRFCGPARATHRHRWALDKLVDRAYRQGSEARTLGSSASAFVERQRRAHTAWARERKPWLLRARGMLGLNDGPPEWAARIGIAWCAGFDGKPIPAAAAVESIPDA